MKKNRYTFIAKDLRLNGYYIKNAILENIKVTFELNQCFCNCSMMLNAHYPDCPNAKPENFIKLV